MSQCNHLGFDIYAIGDLTIYCPLQAEVVRLSFPGYTIRLKLLLLYASKPCGKDGLHQLFKIVQEKDFQSGRSRVQIQTPPNLTRKDIGSLDFLRDWKLLG